MPPDRFLLLVAMVLAAAGLTVALGVTLTGSVAAQDLAVPGAAVLLLAIVWRLLARRLR